MKQLLYTCQPCHFSVNSDHSLDLQCFVHTCTCIHVAAYIYASQQVNACVTWYPTGSSHGEDTYVQHTKHVYTLQVGTVWVNCWLVRDLNVPFGGAKMSGLGREGLKDSLEFYTEVKTVCIKH